MHPQKHTHTPEDIYSRDEKSDRGVKLWNVRVWKQMNRWTKLSGMFYHETFKPLYTWRGDCCAFQCSSIHSFKTFFHQEMIHSLIGFNSLLFCRLLNSQSMIMQREADLKHREELFRLFHVLHEFCFKLRWSIVLDYLRFRYWWSCCWFLES